MDNGSQIHTVQRFVEVIGDNDNLWSILVGREISRFEERVNYRILYKKTLKEERGIKHYTKGRVYAVKNRNQSDMAIEIDYLDGFRVKYEIEIFLKQFDKILPPISIERIFEIFKIEEETRRLTADRHKAQKQEIERRELNKQEAQRQESERRAAQTREIEIRKQEIERREAEKQIWLELLQDQLEQNFLNIDNFYHAQCTEYISFNEYQIEKSKFVQLWVINNLNTSPDLEQAAAIGAVEGHVQVVARAGSGKTSTLVNRALFLQKYCGIAADEMLLLAFNRKAADEIRERFTLKLQGSIPHVMTFHALAYALVHPEESIIFNEPNGGQNKSRVLQNVIDNHLRDPIFYEDIRTLMMAHFREDWERILSGGYDKSPEEMLRYRRSLPKEGIDGTYFKSFGEKLIGDFLFEHNIQYKYERNFWWDGINYRPDFTIVTGDNQGVVIEYFGLEGDPDYDLMSDAKREYWRNHPNWHFVELSPKTLKYEGMEDFCGLLKRCIENYGIRCDRLSEEEIWKKIKVRAIDRFTKVVEAFIQRCRKLCLKSETLAKIVDNHDCASDVEQKFLELAQKFYQSYLDHLQETGEEDFDGLMQQAAALVKSGQTIFKRKSGSGDLKSLRYVLIDEYQDFSLLFHHLIEAIREQNPQAKFFCVGDDWQAINGFAGSDLRFYQNFAQFFQPSQKLHISTNYRSATSIVDIGNRLMQGLGNLARAHTSIFGIVEIADLGQFAPTPKEQQKHPGDIITPAILRLVEQTIQDGKHIVLLSRKNSLPWYVNYGKQQGSSKNGSLESFLHLVRSYLPENLRDAVNISTAHKYKGLQKDVVIILDAVSRSYPLIHPDLMFTRVFGDSIERVIDEERRIFYVALTRAVERLFIVTESNNLSPFLKELKTNKQVNLLDWLDYPPCTVTIPQITIKVGNQSE
jgi:DNA helicase IV